MWNSTNLSSLRYKYNEPKDVFLEKDIKVKEPINIFQDWLNNAIATEEILEPNAACISTVNSDGQPSNRFVLVKEVSKDGFTFFTNYGSRKAQEIESNPHVAMTFYWTPLRRSVRIEGRAEKISREKSLAYFRERPRASQIGALASDQSTRIKSREELDEKERKIKEELGPDKDVPLPNWGGFLVRPHLIEFWQGQTNRLHDRICFRKSNNPKEVDGSLVHQGVDGWVYERLAP